MPKFVFVPAGSQPHAHDWERMAAMHAPLPFVHSVAWARARARPLDRWCRVLDERGEFTAGAVIAIDRSRKLPWAQLARVSQATALLTALDGAGLRALIGALTAEAPRLARITVQAYDVHASALEAERARLYDAGFTEDAQARSYVSTLLLPLDGSRDALQARLSASARRNVRQVAQSGYTVRAITETAYAARLAYLLQASHERTGGQAGSDDLAAMIHTAAADPDSSALLGLFHPDRTGADALVGFAQGTLTPGAATYAVAGTERAADIGRTPLSYGLLWELLEWGRSRGAPWFDFGGVTAHEDAGNALTGISEFKRKFGGTETRIAAECTLITNPLQHRLLELSAGAVQRLRGSG